jgi:hypothetical protein
MNDSAAHKTAGGDAALWRARRDLLADAEARAKEMRRAVEQLRTALEAAGAALPPPADTDARLWPEAAAPPARGGRRSVDDHNAHKRMAALLEAGTARSVPEAARLVEAELKVEEDKLRPAGAKMPAREPGSVAKRLERGYRD